MEITTMWACILGYVAIAVSFYMYVTKTAQIEPETEIDRLGQTPGLRISNQTDTTVARKAA